MSPEKYEQLMTDWRRDLREVIWPDVPLGAKQHADPGAQSWRFVARIIRRLIYFGWTQREIGNIWRIQPRTVRLVIESYRGPIS